MAVVVGDEVRSTHRLAQPEDQVVAWQRSLIQSLRDLSDAHDRRHLKILWGELAGRTVFRGVLTHEDRRSRRRSLLCGYAVGLPQPLGRWGRVPPKGRRAFISGRAAGS